MSCFVVVVVVVLFSFLFICFSSFSPMLLLLFLRLILLAWESSFFPPFVFLSLSFQTHILINLPLVVVVVVVVVLGGDQLSAYLSIFDLCKKITCAFCRKRRLQSPCDCYCWNNPGRTLLDPAMAQSVKHTALFSLRFLHFNLFISFNLFTAKELVLLGQVLWLFRQTSTSILGLAWFQFRVVLFLSGFCF